MSASVKIFLAYSRKDAEYLDELKTHFTPLERTGRVTIWYDGKIEPGAIWELEIKKRLHNADIILLLVSANAIASDYFYDQEMKDALKRHDAGTAKVVPFILRPCAWKATPLSKLQVIPKNGKAATTWNDIDEAYSDAVNRLWELANNIEKRHLEKIAVEQKKKERQKAHTNNTVNSKLIKEKAVDENHSLGFHSGEINQTKLNSDRDVYVFYVLTLMFGILSVVFYESVDDTFAITVPLVIIMVFSILVALKTNSYYKCISIPALYALVWAVIFLAQEGEDFTGLLFLSLIILSTALPGIGIIYKKHK